MTFENFVEKVVNAIHAYLGSGIRLTAQRILRNNGVELTGLIFVNEDNDMAATIYLESFYEEYEKGATLGETVREIIRLYETNRPQEKLDMEFFKDYSQVKTRLSCRLVNRERNDKLLARLPHRSFFDLAVVYTCVLMGDGLGCACVLITKEHLELWGIGEDQLAADAEENMRQIMPPEWMDLDDFIHEMIRQSLGEQLDSVVHLEDPEEDGVLRDRILDGLTRAVTGGRNARKMFVLSNIQHFYGASAVLYPGLLAEYAKEQGCSFFLLPSSVHEMIVIADLGQERPENLKDLVREVNRSSVAEEEFLSDEIYYFSRETGKITLLMD